ncbi:MAG: trypsin-like serine protease [Gemmatimonadales bacterium]|nr:trypsin-like serine protease [Gemmatimonadales bacterium]
MKTLRRIAMPFVVLPLLAAPTSTIVRRHDRDDQAFLDLALRYPSTVTVRKARDRGEPGDAGTLIDPRWVLTAAHVAANLAPGDIAEVGGTSYRIEQVVRHPDWRSNADLRSDIALLRLTEPVTGITPVSIYTGSDEVGMVVTFVGRGGTGTGLTGPVAEDGRLRAATNRVDRAEGSLLQFRFDAPGDSGVTDLEGISGPGDSGGPAYADRNGVRYVVGVSSGQDSRPANRKEGHYKVLEYYPRVSYFANWIRSVTAPPVPPL